MSDTSLFDTRRSFIKSGAVAAAGLAGAVSGHSANPASLPQVPKMKFGSAQISRLVLGTNPFYGYSHFTGNLDFAMRQWYTPERIVEVMHRANQYGVNAFNYVNIGRTSQDFQKFLDEGGKMHLVAQIIGDPAPTYQAFKPLAMYHQGEQVDRAYLNGSMNSVREWCKKARDTGTLVGVGTHKPEVIALVEEQGWDVDFYAGCLYNRTRTAAEWKSVLKGEVTEMTQETYLKSDPARMYRVLRQTPKPCFAFKVLAAGRIADGEVEQAFRTAFENLKPGDGIFVGMWPYRKDEVAEDAALVARILRPEVT
jgi:hypothetical protein